MPPDTPAIEVQPRQRIGTRYARRLRKQGRLPAVIYGHKRETVSVSVDEKEILAHLGRGTHVLRLDIQGSKSETCLVKELQFGYLGDEVIHVDFTRVDLDETVEVRVHLHFVGAPAATAPAGAILTHDLTDLEVTCRVNEIPEEIRVDLTAMGEGTMLTVGQVSLPPGVRANAAADTPIAHVSFVHAEEAVGEEVEVAPGPTEPEVITEAKPEEGKEAESEASP